ncbi:MAG: histidinol-phosphate aminotransferase family protein [Polyangiaceae bacterium]|nr:histidinol-phosphate aminotransferase family protein [Polyangiaceae bacterium]
MLRRYDSNRALRLYPAADNGDLKAAIAKDAGVQPRNVLVANGSGPLLKTCIPYLIETKIKRSPGRMLRYLLKRVAYPIITTRLTYSKVPASGVKQGLRCVLLPLGPESGFALDVGLLEAQLAEHDGVVYLANPNNPTGNILITRSQLEPLLTRYPDSIFFVDEAYLGYVPESPETCLSDLVLRHSNLVVLRSFSFAHGLASIRVGYALAGAEWIARFETKLTPHRVGQLAAELVMASLEDPRHLDFVREETAKERLRISTSMGRHSSIEVYPSQTNFILCRVKKPWTGQKIHDGLLSRGIRVKCFEPFGDERYDEYFRVTIGLPEENTQFLAQLDDLMRTDVSIN